MALGNGEPNRRALLMCAIGLRVNPKPPCSTAKLKTMFKNVNNARACSGDGLLAWPAQRGFLRAPSCTSVRSVPTLGDQVERGHQRFRIVFEIGERALAEQSHKNIEPVAHFAVTAQARACLDHGL